MKGWPWYHFTILHYRLLVLLKRHVLVFLSTAPSEPLELICNSLSDQGIHLAWKKPSQSNGIIRYYLITTSEKVTGQQVGKPINKTFHANTALMKIVSGLKPYREYVLHVRAVTVTPGKAAFCLARTEAGGKLIKRSHWSNSRILCNNRFSNRFAIHDNGKRCFFCIIFSTK